MKRSELRGRADVYGVALSFVSFALALGLVGCSEPEPAVVTALEEPLSGAGQGLNIWLLTLDTVRADRIGAWQPGQPSRTPAIDALVSSGVRFASASATRGETWPSLASVLTGQLPSEHGLIYNGYEFQNDQPTLPHLLAARHYDTAAFLSNMCQANHTGWETFSCSGGSDGRLIRSVEEWVAERQRSESEEDHSPFLLWTHLFAAHGPYYNGGDLAARELDPEYEGDLRPKKGVLDRIMAEGIPLDEADLTHLDAIYEAAMVGTDNSVGRLVETLRAAGELERTLIVLLADHGEDLYDHNAYLYHSCSVYESTLRVPLAFVLPAGRLAGRTVETPVSLVDVLATTLDLLGLPLAGPDAHSLVPCIERQDHCPSRDIFTEYGETDIATLRREQYKLVVNPGGEPPVCVPNAPGFQYPIAPVELYDLVSDPEEQRNLAERSSRTDHAELISAMKGEIEGRLARRSTHEQQTIDDDLRRQLEELGYVVDGPGEGGSMGGEPPEPEEADDGG